MKRKLNCILLIDDNDADNFYHERVIKKMNCTEQVIAKQSGQEALEYLQLIHTTTHPNPDLIFLDINMPGMNGWEFLEEYNKLQESQRARVILIMLTTSLNPDDEESGKKNDKVNNFVKKPLDRDTLVEILEKHFKDFF